jgi:hypothetical protein
MPPSVRLVFFVQAGRGWSAFHSEGQDLDDLDHSMEREGMAWVIPIGQGWIGRTHKEQGKGGIVLFEGNCNVKNMEVESIGFFYMPGRVLG